MTRKLIETLIILIAGSIFVTQVSGPFFDRVFGVGAFATLVSTIFALGLGWTIAGHIPLVKGQANER